MAHKQMVKGEIFIGNRIYQKQVINYKEKSIIELAFYLSVELVEIKQNLLNMNLEMQKLSKKIGEVL